MSMVMPTELACIRHIPFQQNSSIHMNSCALSCDACSGAFMHGQALQRMTRENHANNQTFQGSEGLSGPKAVAILAPRCRQLSLKIHREAV